MAAAFAAECSGCERTLSGVAVDAWDRPALGSWTVAQLAAHLVRATTRVDAYLDTPVPADAASGVAGVPPASPIDRVTYWQVDLAAMAPEIAARAVAEAAAVPATTLPAAFAEGWRSTQRHVETAPDRLLATPFGPMTVQEYVATRVLEILVHHLDLRRALDLPSAPDPHAARLVVEMLEGLLGAPRPRALGRDRFILAATGRIPSDDPRFPVLR